MQRYPAVCLGILLHLGFAISAEGLPERRLQPPNSRIPIQTQENEDHRAFVLSMKIINRIYSQSLEDHKSDDYIKLSDDVRNLLQQIFGCLECATYQTYRGAADITFSNGSVIADSTLVFETVFPINGDIVKNLFCNAILTGPLNTSISVNPTYTNNLPAPVTVPVPVMTTTPQPTTTSLSVPTTSQNVHTSNQYYPDVSSSTDSDLSKATSPSHNIPDSTYTSTPEPIIDTATTLSSHVTNSLNSSPTTSSKNNSEFSTSHVTNEPNNSATTLSESTTDSTDTTSHAAISENTIDSSTNPPLIITSHTTRGPLKTDASTFWRTANPHHNTTTFWHPSNRTNLPPKASTNATSSHNHSHIVVLPTTKPKNGSAASSSSYGGVPGWGIALLVLASVTLLLLIIFFILALWHWCCHQDETGLINVTGSSKPYDREPSAPEFLTMDPYRKIYPEEFEKPKKNRTGMYVVNP